MSHGIRFPLSDNTPFYLKTQRKKCEIVGSNQKEEETWSDS